MADPYEMIVANQFNLPAIQAAAQQARRGRLAEMMLGRQMEQENRMAEREQKVQQARVKVGQQYSAGDTRGARQTALATGEPDVIEMLSKLDKSQAEMVQQRAGLIGHVAQWADTPDKWDRGVDFLVASGYHDVAQYKGQFSPENRMSALAASGQIKDYYERSKPVNVGPGAHLVDPASGKSLFSAPFAPKLQGIDPEDDVYETGGGGMEGGGFDSFYQQFLAPAEGGYVASDGRSGAPANFGVNQKANPDVDVASLTQEQAKQIMHDRYWVPSGADQIEDPALQAIHADTAVNAGVGRAKQMLQESGGDPARYLALREQFYRSLGGSDLPGWLNRNQKLAQYTGLATSGPRLVKKGAPKEEKPEGEVVTDPPGLPPGTWWIKKGEAPKRLDGDEDSPDAPYSQTALDAFDRAISSAQRLKQHPGFGAAVGSGFDPQSWGSFNPLTGNTFAGTEAANFRAELDAMKAQVFLPMVQSLKGMGQLSNAEGQKLTDAIGALDTNMKETGFRSSLDRIIADLTTYRNRGQKPKAQPRRASSGGSNVIRYDAKGNRIP